ncbi:MAG: J domain-containing protein, partial [Alloprevotella tannerae]|nr:J domain-containing protein [Alloprevotella tannerae]
EMHFGGTNRSARYTNSSVDYNLNLSVSIDMYTALLGGDIILQTSNGKLKLKVKPETQNGTKVRLKGKGYDKGDGTFGDMIITYDVKLPKHLSERQRELLKQMREG